MVGRFSLMSIAGPTGIPYLENFLNLHQSLGREVHPGIRPLGSSEDLGIYHLPSQFHAFQVISGVCPFYGDFLCF